MGRIKANFADVPLPGKIAPAGDFEAIVTKVESKKSSTNKDMELIISELDDPAHPELKGVTVWDQLVLQNNDGELNRISLGRIKEYAVATGYSEEDVDAADEIITEDFVGHRVLLTLGVEEEREYKDKDGNKKTAAPRNNVRRVSPIE